MAGDGVVTRAMAEVMGAMVVVAMAEAMMGAMAEVDMAAVMVTVATGVAITEDMEEAGWEVER